MLTDRDIALWRLRSQRLDPPRAASAEEVVGHLLAMQAENPGQTAWAVAARTESPDARELEGLLERGDVIRTHVLRPTWHYARSTDVRWLLELTAPRVRPLVLRQLHHDHGLSPLELDRVRSAVLEILADGAHRTREELAAALRDGGRATKGPALVLVLASLELDALICSGRPRDGAHTYALFEERVRSSRRLERSDALAELALRYATGHGPATEKDLAYWASLPLADVRAGLEQVRHRLDRFEHRGRTYWHAPVVEPPAAPAAAPADSTGHLLQILDELYRGYQDSRMVLDADGVVPSGRESAVGMALVDGQLVARMQRTIGRRVVFTLTPYRSALAPHERSALEAAASRYGAFLGLEHEIRLA